MPKKSMAEALVEAEERDSQSNNDPQEQKRKLLELKRQAFQSREVEAFVKRGEGAPADIEIPPIESSRLAEVEKVIQLNTRIPELLLTRVKRAAFENKASGLKPDSIQDVVMHALDTELKRLGY